MIVSFAVSLLSVIGFGPLKAYAYLDPGGLGMEIAAHCKLVRSEFAGDEINPAFGRPVGDCKDDGVRRDERVWALCASGVPPFGGTPSCVY